MIGTLLIYDLSQIGTQPNKKKYRSSVGSLQSVFSLPVAQYTALRPSPNILIQFAYFANEAADIHFVRPVSPKEKHFPEKLNE